MPIRPPCGRSRVVRERNAALLYELVQAEGATIAITGSPPRASLHAGGQHYRGARSTDVPEQELFSNPFAPLFGD